MSEPISLGSASIIALPVWRSTKEDPPPPNERVYARRWVENENRWMVLSFAGSHVQEFAHFYPSWFPLEPNSNDGTTPEDWL